MPQRRSEPSSSSKKKKKAVSFQLPPPPRIPPPCPPLSPPTSASTTMPALKSPQKQSSSLDRRITKAIINILSQPTAQWVSGAEHLVANVRQNRKGITNLKVKMGAAADAKVAEAARMADVLRREPCLEPGAEDKVFMIFKARRIARLFLGKPEMLEYLRTRAQMASFNKGWKGKVKLYEEIAIDPENIIAGAELLCLIDEGGGSLVEGANCTIRETLDAMDWYADNKHPAISAIYEEYLDVPTKEMFLGVGEEGPARSLSRTES